MDLLLLKSTFSNFEVLRSTSGRQKGETWLYQLEPSFNMKGPSGECYQHPTQCFGPIPFPCTPAFFPFGLSLVQQVPSARSTQGGQYTQRPPSSPVTLTGNLLCWLLSCPLMINFVHLAEPQVPGLVLCR